MRSKRLGLSVCLWFTSLLAAMSSSALLAIENNPLAVNFGGLPSILTWETNGLDSEITIYIETNYYQEKDQLNINRHMGKKRCRPGKQMIEKGANDVRFDCAYYQGHGHYLDVEELLDISSVNLSCGGEVRELALQETFLLSDDSRWLEATFDNDCAGAGAITAISAGKKIKFPRSVRKTHLSPKKVPNRAYDYTKPLQECLTGLGIDVGIPNGKAGPKTKNGIEEFQRRYQTLVIGEVNVLTFIQCWDATSGWKSVKEEVFDF